MDVHSSFTKNRDLNPQSISQFQCNVPSFQFKFPNKEKYMIFLSHRNHIKGNTYSHMAVDFDPYTLH